MLTKPIAITILKDKKHTISEYFDSLSKRIFTLHQLSNILTENRITWQLSHSINAKTFIEFLLSETKLVEITGKSPFTSYKRYGWVPYSMYEFGISLRQNSYISHLSALEIHGLTNPSQTNNSVYVNLEQPPKNINSSSLDQQSIDGAFNRPARMTNNIVKINEYEIFLLNGMFTGKHSVINKQLPNGSYLDVTDIERTLIDCTVRTAYSGGFEVVLGAYRQAYNKISASKLFQTFTDLGYTYPYHQAIGFYLEKAGVYNDADLDLFRNLEINFNFYLTYDMQDRMYSESWHLYYPIALG